MTDNVQTDAVDQVDTVESDDHEIDWSKAQEGVRLLLEAVGEDPDAENLQETWERRVPAAFETLTAGTRAEEKPTLRTFEASGDNLIIKTGIPLYSLCEHHLLPYYGTAHVAYRPSGEVVGLSKLPRYIRWQSRRLTMQEQLTSDIAHGLGDEINAEAVAVEINTTHLCEAMRGIETATVTTTRATVGEFSTEERKQINQQIQTND
jgi:GTP cyclohydrolase I